MPVPSLQVEFRLKRQRKINKYMDYVMLLAFVIIASISIVYIPFIEKVRDIEIAQARINTLQSQLNALQAETTPGTTISQLQRNYSIAYDTLLSVDSPVHKRITDIHEVAFDGIEIASYSMNSSSKQFSLVIFADEFSMIARFNSDIIDQLGIIEGIDTDIRWVTSSRTSGSITVVGGAFRTEVIINYA